MWSTLTVIDEKERRVLRAVGGGEWIFATAAQDPRSIDDFIQAELAISGFSLFKGGIQNPTLDQIEKARVEAGLGNNALYSEVLALLKPNYSVHPANSNAGTKRSPDNGGTIIVDTRDKVITVKAYPVRRMDEIPQKRKIHAKKQGKQIINPETEEAWYYNWGLLSELRSGTAGFRMVIEEGYINKNYFEKSPRHDISNPQNPTKDNPEIYWMIHPTHEHILDRDKGQTYAQKIKTWVTPYTLPNSWTIRDGILRKNYCGGQSQ
jgi:hypothetical protein